jgi:hypothetical protein
LQCEIATTKNRAENLYEKETGQSMKCMRWGEESDKKRSQKVYSFEQQRRVSLDEKKLHVE